MSFCLIYELINWNLIVLMHAYGFCDECKMLRRNLHKHNILGFFFFYKMCSVKQTRSVKLAVFNTTGENRKWEERKRIFITRIKQNSWYFDYYSKFMSYKNVNQYQSESLRLAFRLSQLSDIQTYMYSCMYVCIYR